MNNIIASDVMVNVVNQLGLNVLKVSIYFLNTNTYVEQNNAVFNKKVLVYCLLLYLHNMYRYLKQ